MAQRISPYSIAEETLLMSSQGRGQQGMQSTSAPVGPQLYNDGSPIASAAATNNQDYANQLLATQNAAENTRSAIPQAGANAINQVRNQVAAESDAKGKAQEFANAHMAALLYANERGSKLMQVNGIMQGPDAAKFEHDIATGKVMAMGMNPDLAGA